MPEVVVSDNGLPFPTVTLLSLRTSIALITTRRVPISTSLWCCRVRREKKKKTAKKRLAQADPDVVLLTYRTTPHSATGIGSSVVLKGS